MTYWLWSIPPDNFSAYDRAGTFAVRRVGRGAMQAIRPGDRIAAYLPGRRAVAGLYEATSAAFEDATSLVPTGTYPHRVRVRPLVRLREEAYVAYEAFADKLTVLDEYADRGEAVSRRFAAVAQRVVHPLPSVDGKVLEFLIRTREGSDLDAMMVAFERLLRSRSGDPEPSVAEPPVDYRALAAWDRAEAMERLIETVGQRGFVYQPWQIAAYVTALRTKPFVILAGVTGVGKSRLPTLVAEATGGAAHVLPVRPDWTDSAEVLGYRDLQGTFRPGALLSVARNAVTRPEQFIVAVLDEMNLARPEHYLAEVLSRIESRRPAPEGGYESAPLLADDAHGTRLPPNLGLVGTVNMDESAHGFSRKVLDRAFTLELSATELAAWQTAGESSTDVEPWPVAAWHPRALRLGELTALGAEDRQRVERVVSVLNEANGLLAPAGFGLGYRLRDEAALFALHAAETPDAFRTRNGAAVDPLDLALFMKLLPRIAGSARSVRRALFGLLGWALRGTPLRAEDDMREAVEMWGRNGRPAALDDARYPRTTARLLLMTDRLLTDGFASFWE